MSRNLPRQRASSGRVIPPVELAGKWIAWDKSHTRIIASGESLSEVDKKARLTGEEQFILQKVPRADTVYVGAA